MTDKVELTITTEGPGLDAVFEAVNDISIPLRQSVQAWRALGRQEFEDAAWRPPSGAPRGWAPTLAGTTPLGGITSSVLAA